MNSDEIGEKWDEIRKQEKNSFIVGGILFGIVGFLIGVFIGIGI